MQEYKTMYFNLFNEVTKAIKILQKAQQDAEDTYIESKGEESILTKQDDDE